MKLKYILVCTLALLGALAFPISPARAQGTAFTYQGRLNDASSPANGSYDLTFTLYYFNGPGSELVAGPVTNTATAVSNGLFTATLDFGSFNGPNYWLQIGVRTNGNGAFTPLNPRQPITPAPYALYATTAGTLNGTVPLSQLPATLVTNGATDVSIAGAFFGNGAGVTNVPGTFSWLTVTGPAVQAGASLGFIVTNNTTPVTITLPAQPNVGDTFKLAGAGVAGWILAQNPGQQILTGNLVSRIGVNWVRRFANAAFNFTALASSADGTHLIAATSSGTTGTLYLSADSGASWTTTAATVVNPTRMVGPQYWSSVASSTDGTHLLATVGDKSGHAGVVFFSTNSGATWSVTNLAAPWIASACSADGTKMFVASYNGYIFYSTNGLNWPLYYYNSSAAFTGLACSADGTKLIACATGNNGGNIYISGVPSAGAGLKTWSAVASSASGSNLVATVTGGFIYTSSDGGATWTPQNQLSSLAWTSVASSADGARLIAAYNGPGYVFTSSDSGFTWLASAAATNAQWTAVACSADGSKLVAAASDGNLWTSAQGATTTPGTAGFLVGGYLSALELQYIGSGQFLPLSHEGTIRAY